ncbi:hypothetical protein MY5147_009086 [Beauveria neobassiana]|uniref:Uncharacterized protein n=1 Tax=Beauveria bassiana TaxID=176275 RepID=A0A2S7YDE3_BEABA|nr:hypothetical protein BB8028_0004g08840 [Beauveria bassiana]
MNWNNGQLARHSRRSYNNDATRQKQYFAQAKRQKVTDSRRRKYNAENFVPSYLKDPQEISVQQIPGATRHREPRSRLLTLQDLPETLQQATEYPKDGGRIEKIKRIHNSQEQDDTSMDAKRRRLLQQSDWSGVELQKPVIITYPETARSRKSFQRHLSHSQFGSPLAEASNDQISAHTVIKIANQEYRWSPGKSSIRTWHSKGQSALPETPIVERGSLYDISSSASKSFNSFIPESPCAERALQIGKAKAGRETQVQSMSHTSPSIFDQPLVKAIPATQFLHPQPIRCMPQSVYARLSDSALSSDVALNLEPASLSRLQSDGSSYVAATESKSGESVVAEPVKENSSSKISESPREFRQPGICNGLPLSIERNLDLPSPRRPSSQAIADVPDRGFLRRSDSLPSSITTPDVYRIAETSHLGNQLSALPYKRSVPMAPELGNEDENMVWKRFVLGSCHSVPVAIKSSEHCGPEGDEASDSRSKLGVKTAAIEENASPGPTTRRCQVPTPAPIGPAPPLTISAKGPSTTSMRFSNKPQTTCDDEAPACFVELRDEPEVMTAFPTESKTVSQSTLPEVQHMTLKPESTFHPPSLFVGRLAASGGAGAAVAAVPKTSEPEQSSSFAPKAPSGRVMSRRRRNRRREAGRPDIRALPNIQGDPIEFTP